MKRQKFATRKFFLRTKAQLETLLSLLPNLPLDDEHPLEVRIGEMVKVRGLDQNSLMWVNQLADIAEQAWIEGKKYRDVVWHEQFKELYLPEEFDEELTKEGYCKWEIRPDGKRALIGSTTQLTRKGFTQYLTQIEAFGASLVVQFGARRMAA